MTVGQGSGSTPSNADPALVALMSQLMGSGGNGTDTQKNIVLMPSLLPEKTPIDNWLPEWTKHKEFGVQQAIGYYMLMSDSEKTQLKTHFDTFGKYEWKTPKSMWAAAVNASANSGFTPWDVMSQYSSNTDAIASSKAASAAKGPYMGARTQTDLSNVFDAKALVNAALGQYLGRQATDKEIAAFHAKLNAQQTANPNVSDPTKAVDGNITATTTSGGVNPQQLAEDYAKGQTDFAETQASTTGLSWLTDALRAGASGRMA
jgi:hypothetical protein